MRLLIITAILSLSLQAATGFISASQLNDMLHNKDLVVIDVGSQKDYLQEHIPGAVLSDIKAWRKPVQKHQLMRSSSEIQKEMRRLGITKNSQVVIYGHNKPKEALKSSYMALAMIVNGFKNVALLNGGYPEWEDDDDRAVTDTMEHNTKGDVIIKYQPGTVVDMAYTKAHIGKIPMLEARPSVFYYGTLRSSGVKRIGHIPQAMSSFWKDKFQIDGTLQDEEILKEIFFDGFNLNRDKEVLLYCTGGLEASMNWFILSQHMHFKKAKIYDGSMREWANLDNTPMVRYKWETFGY